MGGSPSRSLVDALTHDLRRASFSMHRRFRSTLAKRGLSMGQFLVLRTLAASDRGTTKDLARSMSVTTGNISGLVDKLEAEGMVVRERSKGDRRVVYLKATGKGRRLLRDLRDEVITEISKIFEGWNPKEIEQLDGLLRRIIETDRCAC